MLHGTNDQKGIQGLLKKWLPDVKFDVLVKCWAFTHGQKKVRSCVGEHTALIKNTMKCSEWKNLMGDFPSQLEQLWKHKDNVLVLCADSHGVHRSVAVAAILKHLYEKKGYQSKGPHHLCSDSWQKRKLCHTCKQCIPNEEKEKMYDALAAEYQC